MKTRMKSIATALALCAMLINVSCEKDPPLPDNTLSFAVSEVGFETAETSKTIAVNALYSVSEATQVTLAVTENGIAYGTQYTTEPAASNGKITLTLAAGQKQATFVVKKATGILLDGTETLQFAFDAAGSNVVIDKTKSMTLKFGSIISEGSTMIIEGKLNATDAVVEPVYIDLSRNEQVRMADLSYLLGFYCGEDFKVLLNNSADVRSTFAGKTYETTKTDIAAVTVDDARQAINIGASLMSAEGMPLSGIDNVNGSLDELVFKTVSANEAENKVYLVTTGVSQPEAWYKVKVNRKNNGYSVQYALVGDATVKTVDIEKKPEFNQLGLDLATGKVIEREPQKNQWDILYASGMNEVAMGAMGARPYFMHDLIFINNLGGVQAAEVKVVTVSYENFTEAHINGLTFSSDRNFIGSNWRQGGGPTSQPRVFTDRFFIIKDAAGNHYKLRFLSMSQADGGVRGRPEIEYQLVK